MRKWYTTRNTTMQVHEPSISGQDRGRRAPIEQIVDSDGQSLNVGVVDRKRVNKETRGHCRALQPNVLVVNLGGPVGGKCPFDAPAAYPAADGSGFAEGCERRVDGGAGLDPSTAAFNVKQPMFKARAGKPDAARKRRNPIRLHRSRD